MIVLIGSHYLNEQVDDVAKLSQLVRASITAELSPTLGLVKFQALLLCHFFDDFMSSSDAQFAAHCFSSVLMSIVRRKILKVKHEDSSEGRQTPTELSTQQDLEDPDKAWRQWILEESTARALYALLFVDSQLSSFWGSHCSRRWGSSTTFSRLCQIDACLILRHSATSNALFLPSNPSAWDADNAIAWRAANSEVEIAASVYAGRPFAPRSGYRSALLSALRAQDLPTTAKQPWSRLMLIQGVTTIAWDLRTRFASGKSFCENAQLSSTYIEC